ncbi:NAD(P)/FAD-dependent oxidoreductase [Streptomyces monticola]|uniref:NAD(P)/FAD-dependent oxidoreductase n=1 Tax=Streptomyces monticola TaxID=2666263 RepID=A0ABW2JSQ7_9ACTN
MSHRKRLRRPLDMTTTPELRARHPRPRHPRPHVVVLGAGYAGLLSALRIAPHARVTLVDPSDRFTERVRLHELAAGRPEVTHPLSVFTVRRGIEHLAARATGIDLHARAVTTDDGRSLTYDRLVYALGSRTAIPAVQDTVRDGDASGSGSGSGNGNGHGDGNGDPRAYTAESAAGLHKRLLDGPGRIAVVGGGLTGIEMAAELAESHPAWEVELLSSGLAESLSRKGRDHVRAALDTLGVTVSLTEGRRVSDPAEVDADAVVWAASMIPNTELAAAAGLALDPVSRRIEVDATQRSTSHPDVYAAGDASARRARDGSLLRMACATALPTGGQAAASVIASLKGTAPRPPRFGYLIQCVSLGRHDGVIQKVRADDSPRELILTGRPAAVTKEQVVRNTVRLLHTVSRHPVAARRVPYLG